MVARCVLSNLNGLMLKIPVVREQLAYKDSYSSSRWPYHLTTQIYITKIRLYSFDLLKPHFYIVKLGFTWVYINFNIFAQKHRVWVLVTLSCRGGSNEYHNLFFEQKYENYQIFFIWKFSVFGGKILLYLNRRVSAMAVNLSHCLFCIY